MSYKVIYDSIYKHIDIHPITLKIINTPPFQRLRYLKQLSVTDYVFPTANHTRFEHSIGVSYLAGKMLRSIRDKQPELDINDLDVLKVEIAGLCHDLGHGPFSHTFDKFLENIEVKSKNIHHENRSCMILKYLVHKYKIDLIENIVNDICDLINPSGNGKNKLFLYHIISNPKNGIDVDKFDYLKRDTFNLGLPYGIDLERLVETARVIDNEICYPEKMLFSISNIFETRGRLHKEIYNHPVVISIELMIMDFLHSLPYDFNNIIDSPKLFLKYTDNIFTDLPDVEQFNNAIRIRDDIWERKIYKYIDQIIIPNELNQNIDDIITTFYNQEDIKNIFKDNIKIIPLHIGYRKNPIFRVKFYNLKKNGNNSYYLSDKKISPLLPSNYEESSVRFYINHKNMKSIGKYYVNQFEEFINCLVKKRDTNGLTI
jgi:HD superfamily phosphohydrolase